MRVRVHGTGLVISSAIWPYVDAHFRLRSDELGMVQNDINPISPAMLC
jgi:hypothetical protein